MQDLSKIKGKYWTKERNKPKIFIQSKLNSQNLAKLLDSGAKKIDVRHSLLVGVVSKLMTML